MTSKKSKYRNKSCIVDGIRFASLAESRRYKELKMLKLAHKIKDFDMQPGFVLQPAFRKCPECLHIQGHVPYSKKKQDTHCHECGSRTKVYEAIEYVADFRVVLADGTEVIEDVKGSKGYMTDVFKIKHKLFETKFPDKTIEIVVMSAGRKL